MMNNWRMWAGAGGAALALLLMVYAFRSSCGGTQLPVRRTPPEPPAVAGAPAPATPPASPASPGAAAPAAAVASPTAPEAPTAGGSTSYYSLRAVRQTAPLAGAVDQRRTRLQRMTRIVMALEDYVAAKGTYPAAAIAASDGRPLLSWRVALLPFLGYHELYGRFKLDEPWNSEHNLAVAALVPSVYQAPEAPSDRTPFVVPTGPDTAFSGPARGTSGFADGHTNTAILLALDPSRGVPWTQPLDAPLTPGRGVIRPALEPLPPDGLLVALGGGLITSVPADLPEAVLAALFTPGGDDGPEIAAIYRPAMISGREQIASRTPATPAASARPPATPGELDPTPLSPASVGALPAGDPARGAVTPADVSSYLFAGAEAIRKNQWTEGYALLHAAAIATDDPALRNELRWVPALKRPALAVRWGIGVEVIGPPNAPRSPITWTNKSQRPVAIPVRVAADLKSNAGELAERLLELLEESYQEQKFGPAVPRLLAWNSKEQSLRPVFQVVPGESLLRTEPQSPVATYLGSGSLKQLGQFARMANVDLLLVFEVEFKPLRNGQFAQTTTVKIVDPVGLESLVTSPGLNSIRVAVERNEQPTDPDPVVVGLERVVRFVREQAAGGDLPPGLLPAHAQKRVETLLAEEHRDPLAALVEIRLYHDRKLIGDEQLLKAYQKLLGDVAGSKLLVGTTAQKMEALGKWLPKLRPLTATAAAREDAE